MATISTQTENDITTLYRFRDVAEDTCSADAVTDALMSQIEEKMDIIKKLEETLAEKNEIIGEYHALEKDYEPTPMRRGGEPPSVSSLQGLIEDMVEEPTWSVLDEWILKKE